MKRCPECRRNYYDDTLMYCLEDGVALVQGSVASPDQPGEIHSTASPQAFEPATAILHSTPAPGEPATRIFSSGVGRQIDNANAIAVMPFANMSRDEDAEYLSDGLAEELLNVLSRIRGLRVAGRTSSFSFKGKQTTFAEIGRLLNVSSVLEGSVRSAGKRVRISVQLVNVADGYHLWSQTYDKTLDDIFAIQDDIANSVVEEVRSRLAGEGPDSVLRSQVAAEIAHAAKGRTEDPEAHRLMLLGRHFAERRTADDMARAVAVFEKSLEIDPQNPECWTELGTAQHRRAGDGFVGYAEGYSAARAAAEKALSLKPDLAIGHALLAKVKMQADLDFAAADRSIRRALELEPENLYVLLAAGGSFRCLGHPKEATEFCRKAVELDPLNATALSSVCANAFFAEEFEEVEAAGRRAIEIIPQIGYTHAVLALALAGQGRLDDARLEAARETISAWKQWAAAIIENAAGETADARKVLDSYIDEFGQAAAFQIAEIYAAMGQVDRAFEYLDLAIASSDPGISDVLVSSFLRPLHSDERWEPLLTKIGIPKQYWPQLSVSVPST